MVPGAVELNPTDACLNGVISFICSKVLDPLYPECSGILAATATGPGVAYCPRGTTLTCDQASGANIYPVCSWIWGATPHLNVDCGGSAPGYALPLCH